jgi:hypothetical protein
MQSSSSSFGSRVSPQPRASAAPSVGTRSHRTAPRQAVRPTTNSIRQTYALKPNGSPQRQIRPRRGVSSGTKSRSTPMHEQPLAVAARPIAWLLRGNGRFFASALAAVCHRASHRTDGSTGPIALGVGASATATSDADHAITLRTQPGANGRSPTLRRHLHWHFVAVESLGVASSG